MDAFNKILGSLGSLNQGIGKGFGALTGPLAIMQAISQFGIAGKEKSALDRQLWYSKHPEAIAALEGQFEKPLTSGLIKGTENVVNASLAEQGLSQAPGIQSQVLSQALAPYIQNEQQMAIMEALKAIGLPAEALASMQGIKSPGNLALLLKSILPNQGQGPQATAPISTGTIADPGLTPPIFGGDPSQANANG